ncbi:hypothetical protein [Streptomyces sp. NBC_01304]|uniref:hypothetical protein n=1 Tax=Streptomyces sp. NBC_01304 TaxID=2903818 RepID=UPI002E0E4F05|nr:hypothetical protein OG430_44960 [Streptomyces sp. NBC_01304]
MNTRLEKAVRRWWLHSRVLDNTTACTVTFTAPDGTKTGHLFALRPGQEWTELAELAAELRRHDTH